MNCCCIPNFKSAIRQIVCSPTCVYTSFNYSIIQRKIDISNDLTKLKWIEIEKSIRADFSLFRSISLIIQVASVFRLCCCGCVVRRHRYCYGTRQTQFAIVCTIQLTLLKIINGTMM